MISDEKLDKLIEELGCVRALLERLLRVMDEGLFLDYQFEKWGRIVNITQRCPDCKSKLIKIGSVEYKCEKCNSIWRVTYLGQTATSFDMCRTTGLPECTGDATQGYP